jgi:hypothetical protein
MSDNTAPAIPCQPPSSPPRLDYIGTIQHAPCCVVGWIRKPGRCIPVGCGRWECSRCCQEKGKKAWARIKHSEAGTYSRLMTLPFYVGPNRSWQEALHESGNTLNRFFVGLKRVCHGLRYVWVREIGKKSNMVHFHVLVSRYLPKSLLSRLWASAGGGSVVDIHLIRSSSSYVVKYLAKSPSLPLEVTIALRGLRRYSSSRGLLAPKLSSLLWQGATFSKVFPPLALQTKVLCVVDGIYFYKEGG